MRVVLARPGNCDEPQSSVTSRKLKDANANCAIACERWPLILQSILAHVHNSQRLLCSIFVHLDLVIIMITHALSICTIGWMAQSVQHYSYNVVHQERKTMLCLCYFRAWDVLQMYSRCTPIVGNARDSTSLARINAGEASWANRCFRSQIIVHKILQVSLRLFASSEVLSSISTTKWRARSEQAEPRSTSMYKRNLLSRRMASTESSEAERWTCPKAS